MWEAEKKTKRESRGMDECTYGDGLPLVEELLGKFHRFVCRLLGGELHEDRRCQRLPQATTYMGMEKRKWVRCLHTGVGIVMRPM